MTAPSSPLIIGFDIGGTKTSVSCGTADGTVLARIVQASATDTGFEGMFGAMASAADELISEWGHPAAIGVSIGGPLDTEKGIIHSPPNLPGWDAIPLRDRLMDRFAVPVYVEHDARAGALAEWLFGAARGANDVVYLTFGTGLGAGMILGGRLHTGATGDAGEVGHWRMSQRGPEAYGKAGSWEALSSGAGLPRLARHLYPDVAWPADLSAQDLIGRARAKDAAASRVIRVSAAWLGNGIAKIIDLLNPEVVVLGSLAVRAGDLFLPIVRRVAAREVTGRNRECRIVASALGDTAGDIAALCAAIVHGQLRGPDP